MIKKFFHSIKTYFNDQKTEDWDWDAVRAKYKAEHFIIEDIKKQKKVVIEMIKFAANEGKFTTTVGLLYPENEEYFKHKGFKVESTDYVTNISWGEKEE